MPRVSIGAGIVAVLVGMGFVCPALAKLRDLGHIPTLDVSLLFLGTTMTLAGMWAVARGVKLIRAK